MFALLARFHLAGVHEEHCYNELAWVGKARRAVGMSLTKPGLSYALPCYFHYMGTLGLGMHWRNGLQVSDGWCLVRGHICRVCNLGGVCY
jgi:hypothetical protein